MNIDKTVKHIQSLHDLIYKLLHYQLNFDKHQLVVVTIDTFL